MQIQLNHFVSNYMGYFRQSIVANAPKIVALATVAISFFAVALYKLSQSSSHKVPKATQGEIPKTLRHLTKTRPVITNKRPPTRKPREEKKRHNIQSV